MRERAFLERGRGRWDHLERVVSDAEARRVLQIDDLAYGYRAATTDLAIARSRGYDARIVAHLDRLVARAHALVYRERARFTWHDAVTLLRSGFPREVRRSWRAIVLCVAVTVATAGVAYRLTIERPVNAYALIDAELVPAVNRSLHDTNFGFDRAFAPAESALIITNNIKVAAVAFAGGVTGGVVTLWIIATNGVMVGTLAALYARHGFGADFWATIAPHGVIELSAIQIAGGAGLLLGAALLRPGRQRRTDALAANARRAGTLIAGVAAMLCVAGTIEGFVSPQRLPMLVRAGVGVATAFALVLYFGFAGRERSEAAALDDRDVRIEDGGA